MNILVTGGAGFIGSHIVNAYIDAGHKVVVVDNLSTGESRFINPKALFHKMDVLDPGIQALLENECIEIINHHAAHISVSNSMINPIFDANTNIIGTLKLLKHSVTLNIKKFIFSSTGGAMYGEQETFPANENHPCQPVSPYGISKMSAEKYLKYFNKEYGLNTTILRYSNVYGPHQNPHGEAGVIAIFCQLLAKDNEPFITGDGKQTRDFISIRDVVHANCIALEPACSGTFNVSTGIETNINHLTRNLIRISGKNIPIKYSPARGGEQRRSVISYKRIKNCFGWEPKVSLREGLLETYQYFQNQKNDYYKDSYKKDTM
jgi:UDP-glucose 4-epimerase